MRKFLALLFCLLFIGYGLCVVGCAPPEPEPEGINIDINVPGVEGEIQIPPPPERVDVDVRRGRVDVGDTHIDWREDK